MAWYLGYYIICQMFEKLRLFKWSDRSYLFISCEIISKLSFKNISEHLCILHLDLHWQTASLENL